MGSPYFYLEPSLTMVDLLKSHYKNPALFSLDYDLVPDKCWPTQAEQVALGYDYVLSLVDGKADRVCCGGDSAGGTLILTLLLSLAKQEDGRVLRPGYATLFSPWVTLVTHENRDNSSDFLSVHSLHSYARQYAGDGHDLNNPMISPGCCTDTAWWTEAAPTYGFYFAFGSEEILAPEIESLVRLLRKVSIPVSVREQKGAVHAWVIANLFLSDTRDKRLFGMKETVKAIAENIHAAYIERELIVRK